MTSIFFHEHLWFYCFVTFKRNHISTTTRGKLKICEPLYRSLIVKKYLQEGDPNLTFTYCPNRKSMFQILKNHISTTASGKLTLFASLYRLLIVNKYLQEGDPNLTFTSCPNRKLKFNIKTNHISTTTRGKFTIVEPLYRSLIVKKIFTRRWPQFDLYFLSKPEVKV